jgi:hypothetical protein
MAGRGREEILKSGGGGGASLDYAVFPRSENAIFFKNKIRVVKTFLTFSQKFYA